VRPGASLFAVVVFFLSRWLQAVRHFLLSFVDFSFREGKKSKQKLEDGEKKLTTKFFIVLQMVSAAATRLLVIMGRNGAVRQNFASFKLI
jgi:hypothetical protein